MGSGLRVDGGASQQGSARVCCLTARSHVCGSPAGRQTALQGHRQVKVSTDLLSLVPTTPVHPSIRPSVCYLGTTLWAHQLQEDQRTGDVRGWVAGGQEAGRPLARWPHSLNCTSSSVQGRGLLTFQLVVRTGGSNPGPNPAPTGRASSPDGIQFRKNQDFKNNSVVTQVKPASKDVSGRTLMCAIACKAYV